MEQEGRTHRRMFTGWRMMKTRLRESEADLFDQRCREEGVSRAEWIRRRLSGIPTRTSALDPNVESLTRKIPQPYAADAHDALLYQATGLNASAEQSRPHDRAAATERARVAARYIEASVFFGIIDLDYQEIENLRRTAEEAGGPPPSTDPPLQVLPSVHAPRRPSATNLGSALSLGGTRPRRRNEPA